jgi:actin-like ATPase involved in cell morphogenesis
MLEIIITLDAFATEITTESLEPFVSSRIIGPLAPLELIETFKDYLREERGIVVGWLSASAAFFELGSREGNFTKILRGRNSETRLPEQVEVTKSEIEAAITDIKGFLIKDVALNIRRWLQHLPPEELATTHILLAGQFKRMAGWADEFAKAIEFPVFIAEDPRVSTHVVLPFPLLAGRKGSPLL